MTLDVEVLKEEFKRNSADFLYHKYLVGNEVWYLKHYLKSTNYSEVYDEFKRYIARKFELQFNDIGIFGSAKTGFSLSPSKNFALFDSNPYKDSDLDLVLVSQKHFDLFWNDYLQKLNNDFLPNYDIVASAILRKFITFQGFDEYKDKPYAYWLKQTGGFQKDIQLKFDIEHKINYRIFESWDAAYLYYLDSIKQVRDKLLQRREHD